MTTRRQGAMALMAVGLAIGWAGAGVADAATGGLPLCQANLATCNTTLATCTTDLGDCTTDLVTSNANLTTCTTDLTTCTADLGTCNADLTQAAADLSACNTSLATCTTQLAAAQQFPATGQTTCYDSSNVATDCANTSGQDGNIRAGAALSYTDNGDGTITDNNTKLMWEKLCDEDPPGTLCPAEHDVDTFYTWAAAFGKIAALNGAAGFAGYTDWRLPNVKELQSIFNYENNVAPVVSSAFDTGCVASCSVTTCSCTQAAFYWSSTTYASGPAVAWGVDFSAGSAGVGVDEKSDPNFVRAVRGGLPLP